MKKLPICAALPLLYLLSGCAVYDSVFHPHRLPTPKMDAATKAKVRAAEKARHKGTSLKAAEPSTNATSTDGDPAAPAAAPGATDDKKKTLSYGELPEGTRIKYDKQGLIKKGLLDRLTLNRRKLHDYDTRPLTPREASRENRKLRKKGHTDHGKEAAPAKEKGEPLNPALDPGPDPGPPTTTPAAPAEALPSKTKGSKKQVLPKPDPTQSDPAPEPKKAKKQVLPKPDPTQSDPAPELKKAKKKASKVPVPKPDPTQSAP